LRHNLVVAPFIYTLF